MSNQQGSGSGQGSDWDDSDGLLGVQGRELACVGPVAVSRKPFSDGENGRDESGKFALGNRGGPGRPPTATNYKGAFRAAVTPEKMQLVFDRLVQDAAAGNTQAAAIVAAYGLGRPKDGIEIQRDTYIQKQERIRQTMFAVQRLVRVFVKDDREAEMVVRCWQNPPEYCI